MPCAPTPDPSLDGLGRIIAQALADTGLTVGTYGVCADLIHVETPSGRLFDVTLDEPSGIDDVVEDEAATGGAPDEPTDDDLAELRRLDVAATPGPWRVDPTDNEFDIESVSPVLLLGMVYAAHDTGNERAETDAELIVAMRNALPGLLAEVERLRAAAPASEDDEATSG